MLKELNISNFKCFKEISLKFGKITLLSGTNSSGKSSAIQALLLFDNLIKKPTSPLNGEWLDIGSFEESRNFITRADSFTVELQTTYTNGYTYNIYVNQNDWVHSPLDEILNFYYLSAHRIGPKNSYQKNFDSENNIGKNGEFLIDLFNKNKTCIVDESRRISEDSHTLEYQVNYWLKKILNVKLEVQDLGLTNLVAASYSFNNNKMVRPYHVGAGISYIIGIIILGLYLDKESVLIIENPEIHLHPKAQSDLADFFCFIANAGIQMIIESHSDHIFNGIRKSIFNNTITNEDVKIHFFKMNEDNLSENHLIEISEKGKIMNYHEGLFDQFDNDLDVLLGL